ncbi:polysaccharide biosynthesis tyrosine autokinase [Nocardioides sp.]|uniref:polysaccharide biosynthesis tyrosine autokinase n=1 Tax=Nocardioides sp. TaxID=35761 RepID=UPI0027215D0E|nr:polysaccharide biosynthesis tyrosine autokinase [Nocardioides sp.]MDO9454965.1 polysaccharide biosynthesis tyrosine autokinase [Nocardioides sp.]
MDLLDYAKALRAHWVGALLIVVVVVASAGTLTLTQTKVYAADAGGFVTAGGSGDAAVGSVSDSLAKSRAASYVDIASSRAVADLVIDDLGLDESASGLIENIAVEQPVDTVLIKITARSSSPVQAQRLADAWIRALAARVAELEDPRGTGAAGVVGVEPVEAAALPGSPVSPRPVLNLGLGLVLGLLLAVAYAVGRSMVDRRLRVDDDVEKRFSVSTVGRIPVHPAGSRRGLQLSDAADEQKWDVGEAFRKLRTNLSYMSIDDPPRVIVVTSPRPEDGKSTVAANLAAAIALSGQPVTLLDGDLRRPTVADTLGLVEGAGLTDVLIGQADLVDVLQDHGELPQLSVLAAGSTPPNPSELLGSQAMQGLLRELALKGMVVIDAPPLLPVTDGAVLTRHSDGALVVVSHGRTVDHELSESLTQLEAVQGRVLGVVFNRVPRRRGTAGYYVPEKEKSGSSSAPHGGKRRAH